MSDLVIALDGLGADAGCPRVAICPLADLPGMVGSWFESALSSVPAPGSDDAWLYGEWRRALSVLAAAAADGDLALAVIACDDLSVSLAPVGPSAGSPAAILAAAAAAL